MKVYFVQRADGSVKIGAVGTSCPEVDRRLARYVRGRAGRGGKVLALTDGYLFVERWFHCRHANARIRREFFTLSNSLQHDIETIRWAGRVVRQPREPGLGERMSGDEWRFIRTAIFQCDVDRMARLLGLAPSTYRGMESSGSTMVVAAGLDVAADLHGVQAPLEDILDALHGFRHRALERAVGLPDLAGVPRETEARR